MRRAFFVTYDICDAKRLRKVFKLLKNFGRHLQLSVFECHLSESELRECQSQLEKLIFKSIDQVLFVDLGSEESESSSRISSLGVPHKLLPQQEALIV